MKKVLLVGLVGFLSGCASIFDAPFEYDAPGYNEAMKLYSIASDAQWKAKQKGKYFDCSDFADAAMGSCDGCRVVTVHQLGLNLMPSTELHAFTVTPSGWVIDIQADAPYEHDPSTYLLRRYQALR